jgi:hypothetical protein
MKAMTENDVILSSVLPINVRDATREVEDSSSTWEAGGDPQIAAYVRSASGNIASVSGSVGSVVDGSGHWFSGYNYGLSAWETVSSTSSTWVGGGGLSAPGFEDWNNTFDVVDSDSAGSAFWVSAYSYSLSAWETVATTSSTWTGGTSPSAPGFEDWNNTFGEVDSGSGGWNTIYGDRTNIIETSSRTDDVRDTSGNWNTIYGDRVNIITTSARTDDVRDTSGNWNTIYGDRTNLITTSARTDDVRDTSGNWNTIYNDRANIITTSARTDDVRDTSGNWNTIYNDRTNLLTTSANTITNTNNVARLDASTTALNVFSGSVDVSTATLDSRVDVIEPLVPSATGHTNWNTIYNDRANIITTSARVDDVRDTSGNWNTIYGDRTNLITTSARTDDVRDTSGNWNTIYGDRTNLITTSARTDDVVATSGNWNTIYGDRANILTTSANTITNTDDVAILDGRVDVIEPLVPSATGFTGWNSTKSTVDAGASNWDTIYGDRTNIRSVSATVDTSNTAFLTGDTPTLSNDLNAGGNNIRGANLNVCSTTGDLTFSSVGDIRLDIASGKYIKSREGGNLLFSGTNAYLLGPNVKIGTTAGLALAWDETEIEKSGSGYDYSLSSWETVRDGSGGWESGGGGSFEGSATASAIYVGLPAGSAIDISGTNAGDTVIDAVGDNYILSIDETAGRAKWVSPPLVTGGDLQQINANVGSEAATFSLGAATLLIRDVVVGTSLSSGPDSNVTFDRSVTASSLTVLSSLSGSPECDVVFSNNVSIESTPDGAPPSNPVALVLKTIDDPPINDTAIGEIRFAGNNDSIANKVYNRLRGVSNDVAAGSEDGSIQLRHLLAGSEVISLIASGGGVTVEESLTVSTCPVPAPVCYAQMDGDGTAAASETKFGAGVTPTTVTDSTGHITWDNTNKEFDISVAGTYHVMATLVINVGTTTLTTIRVKNGATAKNTYVDHGTHAAEDPEEVTIQAAFTCAASDSITVTFQDDGATNINLMAGSSVTVRRLF